MSNELRKSLERRGFRYRLRSTLSSLVDALFNEFSNVCLYWEETQSTMLARKQPQYYNIDLLIMWFRVRLIIMFMFRPDLCKNIPVLIVY